MSTPEPTDAPEPGAALATKSAKGGNAARWRGLLVVVALGLLWISLRQQVLHAAVQASAVTLREASADDEPALRERHLEAIAACERWLAGPAIWLRPLGRNCRP
jgi:hypothetical protein